MSTFLRPILKNAADEWSKACLLATSRKESGAWPNALPVAALGLRMDDETTCIAVGLRLGTPLCNPHECSYCGTAVDDVATHGLSCHQSEGRHPCHAAVNDVIHRAQASAKVTSWQELLGLFRFDGKCPNGCSICCVSWGRYLYGMTHAFTPTHFRMFLWPPERQGPWHRKLSI